MKNKFLRKSITAAFAAVCVLTAMTTAAAAATDYVTNSAMAGEWSWPEDRAMTDEARAAFDNATAKLDGAHYEALELAATQVVAGTNYKILSKVTPTAPGSWSHYAFVTVYEDLSGNATVTDVDETTIKFAPDKIISNGWDMTVDNAVIDEAQAALDKAAAGVDGAGYEAIELVATQSVSGTNYNMLCYIDYVSSGEASGYAFVTVYESLDGSAEITDIADEAATGYKGPLYKNFQDDPDKMPKTAPAAFGKATAGIEGEKYKYVLCESIRTYNYLVTKETARTEYTVISKVTPEAFDVEPYYVELLISEDADGSAIILEKTNSGYIAPDDFDYNDNPDTGAALLPIFPAAAGISALAAVVSRKKKG